MANLIIDTDVWAKENINYEKLTKKSKLSEEHNGLSSAQLRESMT